MIRVAGKATEAGVTLSTMILLGAGGRALSEAHALDSARVCNAMQPRYVSTLVMTPVPGTPLGDDDERGLVDHLDPVELTAELRTFLDALEMRSTIFHSNHASNYVPLAGVLPKDKAKLVASLDAILADPRSAQFVPEWLRGL